MEEIREIALAYYANSSPSFKMKARNLFNDRDTEGNGKISKSEFEKYVRDSNWPHFKRDLFAELDQDGDGLLSFKEAIVFFYMHYMRDILRCDGDCDEYDGDSGKYLKGTYFTCVECFWKSHTGETYNKTYDLCIGCYKNKRFEHEHKTFLDNYALLKSIRQDLMSKSSRYMQEGKENVAAAGRVQEEKQDVVQEASITENKERAIVAANKKPNSNLDWKVLAQGSGIGANVATLVATCTIL